MGALTREDRNRTIWQRIQVRVEPIVGREQADAVASALLEYVIAERLAASTQRITEAAAISSPGVELPARPREASTRQRPECSRCQAQAARGEFPILHSDACARWSGPAESATSSAALEPFVDAREFPARSSRDLGGSL